MTKTLAFLTLMLLLCPPVHASGAPVSDALMDLLHAPGGWVALGIAAVAVIALIVKASRDD